MRYLACARLPTSGPRPDDRGTSWLVWRSLPRHSPFEGRASPRPAARAAAAGGAAAGDCCQGAGHRHRHRHRRHGGALHRRFRRAGLPRADAPRCADIGRDRDDRRYQPGLLLAGSHGRCRADDPEAAAVDQSEPLRAADGDQRRAADPRHRDGPAAGDADPVGNPLPADVGAGGGPGAPWRRHGVHSQPTLARLQETTPCA